MTAAVALALVAVVPALASAVVAARPTLRRAGRTVTSALGIATLAAIVLVVLAGIERDGVVGGDLLRADRAMALLLVVVLGTATVVSSFASRSLDRDDRTSRFFAGIAALATGSVLVLLAVAPLLVALGWVASTWALVGLVGFDRDGPRVPRARRRLVRSLLVGDLALVAALVVAAWQADGVLTDGAGAADQLRAGDVVGVPSLHVVALLLVVAAASRSALVPFHRWLVGTLVAPTPVSAVVHAGFVSGAGILFVRFAPTFVASGPAVVAATTLAVLTVVLGSMASTSRRDVKGSLAWSTVAQMAFMVVQCAVGAFSSAIVHIAGHGMYKAARFLGAGDTVAGAVRSRRRPSGGESLAPAARRVVVVVVASTAVAAGLLIAPPHLSDAGQVLVAVFAWVTAASALAGWIRRHPFAPATTVVTGSVLALGTTLAYFVGLRVMESFLEPVVASSSTAVGPIAVIVVVALAAATMSIPYLPVRGATGVRASQLQAAVERARIRWTSDLVRPVTAPVDRGPVAPSPIDDAERSRIRSDAAGAAAIIAPMWPLASFVAVNPLGGLESQGFDRAAAAARRWLGARTHLSLHEFRADHERGLSRLADLEYVVHQRYAELCARPPLEIEGRLVPPVDVVVTDLLHGPDDVEPRRARTRLDRRGEERLGAVIDDVVAEWLADHVARTGSGAERFVAVSLRRAAGDPRIGVLTSPSARRWLAHLDDDPAAVIGAAFELVGIDAADRSDEMRGHLAHLAGWAGFAKWRNDWALPNDDRPLLAPIEVMAVRAAVEAAVLQSLAPTVPVEHPVDAAASLDSRVHAVAAVLAPRLHERDLRTVRTVLESVPADDRAAIWLHAQERCFDERLLAVLDRVDPGRPVDRPEAQAVFCIDVRSEGLRRHLEQTGDVETFGFAGFFGVPLSIRRIGWEHEEARCPVLVAPSVPAVEQADASAIDAVASRSRLERRHAGLLAAHDAAKKSPGAPFVLAEASGWVSGPVAALRTLVPPKVTPPERRSTRVVIDDTVLVEQRIFAAESVLRTMGLVERFAPLVLLCGHTSRTVNNAHASALDCGACAGAAGDDNALAVAALLNAPDVRHGLVERGIEIPDDTWFVAGLHDTASDHVTILDGASAPASHADRVRRLEEQLDRAGAAQAAVRARHLPASIGDSRARGADWAQVRPEWGLARAAAFVIGPRSLTAGLDLDGRAFLHGYDAQHDPTGRVLETIMTAPLVVAHWIASQYYFSTVDPEVFGAGDKLMHNPIGSVGVVSADGGDLRVGLPLQSTHVDGRRHHQPTRLLAVIQADLARIEEIIGRHRVLQTLVAGSWLRIAARSHPHEPWSIRTPAGTWITDPRPFDVETSIAEDPHVEHAEMT